MCYKLVQCFRCIFEFKNKVLEKILLYYYTTDGVLLCDMIDTLVSELLPVTVLESMQTVLHFHQLDSIILYMIIT